VIRNAQKILTENRLKTLLEGVCQPISLGLAKLGKLFQCSLRPYKRARKISRLGLVGQLWYIKICLEFGLDSDDLLFNV
jgi:hypothetical protein